MEKQREREREIKGEITNFRRRQDIERERIFITRVGEQRERVRKRESEKEREREREREREKAYLVGEREWRKQ